MVAVVTECPCGSSRGLQGIDGAVAISGPPSTCPTSRSHDFHSPKLGVSDYQGRWQDCYARILGFRDACPASASPTSLRAAARTGRRAATRCLTLSAGRKGFSLEGRPGPLNPGPVRRHLRGVGSRMAVDRLSSELRLPRGVTAREAMLLLNTLARLKEHRFGRLILTVNDARVVDVEVVEKVDHDLLRGLSM